MTIAAHCPNGHKILCPDDRAGRSARCPKCASPFRIPLPEAATNGTPRAEVALDALISTTEPQSAQPSVATPADAVDSSGDGAAKVTDRREVKSREAEASSDQIAATITTETGRLNDGVLESTQDAIGEAGELTTDNLEAGKAAEGLLESSQPDARQVSPSSDDDDYQLKPLGEWDAELEVPTSGAPTPARGSPPPLPPIGGTIDAGAVTGRVDAAAPVEAEATLTESMLAQAMKSGTEHTETEQPEARMDQFFDDQAQSERASQAAVDSLGDVASAAHPDHSRAAGDSGSLSDKASSSSETPPSSGSSAKLATPVANGAAGTAPNGIQTTRAATTGQGSGVTKSSNASTTTSSQPLKPGSSKTGAAKPDATKSGAAKNLASKSVGSAAPAVKSDSKVNGAKSDVPQRLPEDMLVFLCPNGHKLNGPKRLAGKVGQCPHCGTRFQIPIPEEDDYEEPGIDDTQTESEEGEYYNDDYGQDAPSGGPEDLASLFESVRAEAEKEAASRSSKSGKGSKVGAGKATAVPPPVPTPPPVHQPVEAQLLDIDRHPLADLVARLWGEREHGGTIEFHLAGGVVMVPEWFDQTLSRKSHGLFASQAADGTVTMTVVPWETITRVVVRGVVGLPDGMFE